MAQISDSTVFSNKDFLSKSEEAREHINLEFDRLIIQINTRRNELLLRLEEVVSRYYCLSKESEAAFVKLEELKQSSRDILNVNLLSDIQGRVLSGLDSEIEGMRKEMSDLDVSFEWNDDIEEIVPDLGTLIINIDRIGWNNKPLTTVDYASKKSPILEKSFPSSDYAFNCVCIDNITSRVYVSFYSTNYLFHVYSQHSGIRVYSKHSGIRVYSQEGDFMFEFGKEVMQKPNGIAIHRDKMYVTQIDSKLILRFRIRNEGVPKRVITLNEYESQLQCAGRLSIDESNGHVYVCDSGNDKIVRFNKFLGYHSNISGKDIFSPLDLKITETRLIILAKEPNAYPIRFYSKESHKPLSCLSLEFVPKHFDIDIEENILIFNGGIYILNPKGKLVHSIEQFHRGYAITGFVLNRINGRIFVFYGISNLLIF